MDLYILRHAIAVEADAPGQTNDFDRPLIAEGEKKLRRVLKAMGKLELSFDRVVSSPYVRARATAELAAAALAPSQSVELRDALGADGDPRELLAELSAIAPAPSSILLVGHEPYLSTLISLLLTGTAQTCVTMKKAGLCKLTVETLQVGQSARLEWLLTPRQMLLMA